MLSEHSSLLGKHSSEARYRFATLKQAGSLSSVKILLSLTRKRILLEEKQLHLQNDADLWTIWVAN